VEVRDLWHRPELAARLGLGVPQLRCIGKRQAEEGPATLVANVYRPARPFGGHPAGRYLAEVLHRLLGFPPRCVRSDQDCALTVDETFFGVAEVEKIAWHLKAAPLDYDNDGWRLRFPGRSIVSVAGQTR